MIIQRCQQGTIGLIELLFDRHQHDLYRFCNYLAPDKEAAAELFQDTWLKVLQKIDRCDLERDIRKWLFTIAANCYRDKWRRQKRWLHILKAHFSNHNDLMTPPLSQQFEQQQELNQLYQSLQLLDDRHRLPLILHYFKGLTLEDISEILQVPLGTVKSRLHNGKSKLRTMMEVAANE